MNRHSYSDDNWDHDDSHGCEDIKEIGRACQKTGIARERGRQPGRQKSTNRFHIKRMFTEHGLSRQAELVRLVRSLAGAPGDGR